MAKDDRDTDHSLRELIREEVGKVREDTAKVVGTLGEHVTNVRVELQGVVIKMEDVNRLQVALDAEKQTREAKDTDLDGRLRKLEDAYNVQSGAQQVQKAHKSLWDNMWVRVGGTLLALVIVAAATTLFNSWANQQAENGLHDRLEAAKNAQP